MKKGHTGFACMNKEEKRTFLSMDLIERMIRIEQRVALSFGKKVHYTKTEYYKNLHKSERDCFEDYLKKQKRKNVLFMIIFILSLSAFLIFGTDITGGAVKEVIKDEQIFNLFDTVSSIMILAIIGLFLVNVIYKKLRNSRFDKDFNILEEVYIKKNTFRHL